MKFKIEAISNAKKLVLPFKLLEKKFLELKVRMHFAEKLTRELFCGGLR